MKNKKIKIIVSCIIVAACLVAVIVGIKIYKTSKLRAEVTSVEYLNYGGYFDYSSEARVISDSMQNVYADSSKSVAHVWVSEGQEVKVGDKLLEYDMSSLSNSLEIEKLKIDDMQNKLETAKKQLEILMKVTPEEETTDLFSDTDAEKNKKKTYTASELKEAIAEKEQEIKGLDLELRRANLEYESLLEGLADGTVLAKIDGVVKSVKGLDEQFDNGSPFMVISASKSLCISGDISEYMLDKIKPGQEISAMNYMTGNTFKAKISSIDTTPDLINYYLGDSNPNTSFYAYKAVIEEGDTSELVIGDYLQITFENLDSENESIFIESAYVREENGRYYVLKEEDGKLVKQFVNTGKSGYGGQSIEIKGGLNNDDYVAFPYGKTAVEGIATKHRNED